MITALEIPAPPTGLLGRVGWTLRDGWTLTRRELSQLRRQPAQIAVALLFPGLMVLLFGYVFGSAISVPGGNYREYLIPGMFAMTSLIGVMTSAALISKDIGEGVMDRFRSMPTARSAVPLGRVVADLLTSALGVAVMAGFGLLVGWHVRNGVGPALAAFGLILLLRFAATWVGVLIGLSVKPETADSLVPLIFPITMLSNSFVPTTGMPDWLRTVTEWNPVSSLVAACRQLFGNTGPVAADPSFPMAHPIAMTVGWSILLVVIFMPLAVWRYRAVGR